MYQDDYADDGSQAITLDEYEKLSMQQHRQRNDLDYGTVGGWGPYADDDQHQQYFRGRKIARAGYEVDSRAEDEADRWLAENG